MQGDPSAVPYAVKTVQELLGQKPMFGICMGHQLLGQAFGGQTFKLKFGHHGGNHPVRHNASGLCCPALPSYVLFRHPCPAKTGNMVKDKVCNYQAHPLFLYPH